MNPADEGAQRQIASLLEERRPETRIEASHNTRSDGLRIDTLFARHDLTFDRGLIRIGPQVRFLRHRGEKFPEIDVFSIGGNATARLSDWFEFATTFFVNKENEPRDKDVTFTHETTASFIPSDVWRFDLTAARRYADENPEVIVKDVFQNDFGGTIRYTPSYDLRVNLRGFYSSYTDAPLGSVRSGAARVPTSPTFSSACASPPTRSRRG